MKKIIYFFLICLMLLFSASCGTPYKARPLPFKAPSSYANATEAAGALIGAEAFVENEAATNAFGFNIREAGMLPVQVVFDNQGGHPLEVNGAQTFLEDHSGNLWPILTREFAYERATKYAQTNQIFSEGAYHAFLGAAGGAIIGAAVGIVTGENVGEALGKGAAVGAATGATLGGMKGYGSGDARRAVINDLRNKSLQEKAVSPNTMAHGFLFFPGEAKSAKRLRLQLVESDTGRIHTIMMNLEP